MKKIVLVALISCLSVQAEEVASSNSGVKFYLGASVVGSWTSSDFKMDYAIDEDIFLNAKPWANHKESSIGRVGMGLTAGIKKRFSNDWFVGGELNYTLSKAKHHHDFVPTEDTEIDNFGENTNITTSRINIRHGDEWGLSLKFGKDIKSYDIYGILGVTTKNVEIEYSIDADGYWVFHGDGFDISTKKRVWGAVFGLGGSKKINDKISCFLEYRYKVYNSAKKSIDCRALAEKAFGGAHDTSDRNFKVKSDKHELSLGVTFNI